MRALSLPFAAYPTRLRRLPQLLLFAGFAAWYYGAGALAASAASGLAVRFRLVVGRLLLQGCFHLFLLILGFLALQAVARQVVPMAEMTALPRRGTAGREWSAGVAVGWGLVVVALLPLLLLGRLHGRMTGQPGVWLEVLVGLGAVALAAATAEIAFRGYPFRCLIAAVGESLAVVLMMLMAGFAAWRDPYTSWSGVLATMLVTLLLSLCWLRTRAVWLSWGLHFGLVASLGLLFGMPVGGSPVMPAVLRAGAFGPDWLTGGDFGPGAALFSLVVLVGGVVVLYRVTRDWAWTYTHGPIVAAGYEVNVAPPAAHTAMEAQAAKAPDLVQILATTPQSISAERAGSAAPPAPVPDRLH